MTEDENEDNDDLENGLCAALIDLRQCVVAGLAALCCLTLDEFDLNSLGDLESFEGHELMTEALIAIGGNQISLKIWESPVEKKLFYSVVKAMAKAQGLTIEKIGAK